MLRHPISDTIKLKELTELANAAIGKALARLQESGIIEETTGNKRNRLGCRCPEWERSIKKEYYSYP